ncbi:MAG: hypothetical protein DMF78_13730 [Acidobacteria bacterium]|nr:MAG: hypothetical protein DMF78_13730 [Acidobacteriota bacterium]
MHCAFAMLLTMAGASQAVQTVESLPDVPAVRLTQPVVVDGVLDEEVWEKAPPVTAFVQREPNEGAAATEKTEVRIAYDDEALYIGARMLDSKPAGIVARLGRRDASLTADELTFYVDPYHDGRGGYYFAVNAAGTMRDGVLYNDDWNDDSWDGIWEGRARVDATGWTVELRIPYSQLRFRREESYRWGVNFRRYICSKKEEDYLVFTPKKASGFVSRFPHLSGLVGITPPRRIALTPYTIGKAEFTGHDAGDPFNDGSRLRPALGADFKVGLGSNLTVDGTVNPDFGQVEVDPAVVNLSDVETFFPEKRPFFVEGANNFRFGQGGATNWWGFNWGNPQLFYSRRIGRAPEGSVPDHDFADAPAGTRIITAGKLTGKVGHGWSVGVLDAVTASETGDFQFAGQRFRAQVEPAANYFVGRALHESADTRRGLGIVATGVVRSLGGSRLRDELDERAFALGLDGWQFLGANKTWVVTGWTALSNVEGSAARITDLQKDALHYFQRPDATHVSLDPARTALSGLAGRATVNKEKGNVLFNAAVGFIDPGFDVSNAGFQWRTDVVNMHAWTGYRWTRPGRFTREADVGFAYFQSYDFGGNRGGPLTRNPRGVEWEGDVRTDDRKMVDVRFGVHGTDYALRSEHGRWLFGGITFRPRSNLLVSFEPEMSWIHNGAQYLDTFDDPLATATYGHRYVFAPLDQTQFAAGVRLNWTFTPRLSLELYAQPLVSSGDYAAPGELARPRSYAFRTYGADGSTFDPKTGDVDPDGPGPAPAFNIGTPDFNFKSLRGNLVLRWEFRPGSTAYAVWTQSRSDKEDGMGEFAFHHSVSRLFSARGDNIFLVKVAYSWHR